jgi:kumamolisin
MSVTVLVRRRPDAGELPDPVATASVPFGEQKYLSREEFAAQFGAAPEDIKLVEDFGRSQGLTVVESSAAKRLVTLSGTAGQMSKAFAVKLGRYKSSAETYRGREGDVHVPKALAQVIEGVFGLDNRRMARRGSTNQGVSPLTPPQVAKLYNFPTSSNGSGQTIGIIEFGGGYKQSDINAFFSRLGLATPQLTDVSVLGATNSPGSSEDAEVVLDIDVGGSVAPGAHIVVYFAPWTEQGWVNAIATAVNDTTNKPSVLSISWGWPEGQTIEGLTWTAQAIQAVNGQFYTATQVGVTVFAASGDYGSSCSYMDKKAHILYPTSDPYVTSCGGTTIKNVSGTAFTEQLGPTPVEE